eukprot:COSAG05_NODE_266_length_12619_cov_81.601677_8_plen_74_part_00
MCGQVLRLCVVSEHYGMNLGELLVHSYPTGLPEPWLWGVATQLLAGVAALHGHGIAHQCMRCFGAEPICSPVP